MEKSVQRAACVVLAFNCLSFFNPGRCQLHKCVLVARKKKEYCERQTGILELHVIQVPIRKLVAKK
jgi:hypothetical protein